MPTDAQLREKYEAYLRGESPPAPASASDRVEEKIRNAAKAKSVDYEFSKSVENFPSSALEAGKDIANMYMNPIDTAAGLGKAAIGGVQHLIPGEQSYEPYGSAVADHFSNRYGGLDEFKTTLMEDPAGVGLDALGMASGVGMLPKMGKVGRIASALDPTDLPIKAAGGLLDPASMYKSAAKFPMRFDRDAVTKTALGERIMPTEAGQMKGQGIISQLGDDVANMIDNSVANGEMISAEAILRPVMELQQEASGFKLGGEANVAKIQKTVDDFNQLVDKKGYGLVDAKTVQKFKRDIYDSINWSKTKNKGSRIATDTKKAFARGAKEELEKIIPEIKGTNLKQGDMIELVDALERPAKRISNRDMGGIGIPIKTGVGNIVGETVGGLMGAPGFGSAVGTTAGAVWGFLDNPRTKARMAIEINAIKNSPISNAQARVAVLELLRNEAARNEEAQTITNQ